MYKTDDPSCPWGDQAEVEVDKVKDTCVNHVERLSAAAVCGDQDLASLCCQTCGQLRKQGTDSEWHH